MPLLRRLRRALPSASTPPPGWPRFRSPLHTPAVTARVGRVLGICFAICFVTGLLSLYQYQPWSWLPEPATPAWGYRLSQGLHVFTGIACIPLLLIKLWAVYPRLFVWPPARSVLEALERLSIAVLVSSALVEVTIGFVNILDWYPWHFDFLFVHRTLAYVVVGALLVHIAVKLPVIQEGLATPLREPSDDGADGGAGASRRGVLVAAAAGVGAVTLTTVGQTLSPLEPLAVLAPRRPDQAPAGVPINGTARGRGVTMTAQAASWRLSVLGPHPYDLDLAKLAALPTVEQHFPLACVEGWSVAAHWRGPSLLSVIERAGGNRDSRVRVTSLQRVGPYHTSVVEGPQVAAAILATHLNGERLGLDHGYPLRLIAPNRAGVMNTKWLTTVVIE